MSDTSSLDDLIDKEYTYPSPTNPELQSIIYNKREFHVNKIPERPNLDNYDDIKELRDEICANPKGMRPHQAFLSNLINPDTPYKGILVIHGTGTGKTCAAINIAEKFKDMVQKYNTKIHILVQGPILRENWSKELLKCTGETYKAYQDKTMVNFS